ncbi:MAG: hypothetical protein K1V96_08810 [Lachnospiraceae bacterium]
MSQAKVDRYKEEKANRKKIMKQEKIKRTITTVCSTVVCIAVIGWVGYSAYGYFHTQKEKNPTQTEVNLDALNNYLNGLNTETTAE